MVITLKEADDVKIMAFEGQLDSTTSPNAEIEINQQLDNGASKLLINFENLNYISGAGLTVLLATVKKLKAKGGQMRICGLNGAVEEVFEISGLNSVFGVMVSESEALSDF
jgi:anti-anti-sigma factor